MKILLRRKICLCSSIFLLLTFCGKDFPQSFPFGHFSVQEGLSNSFVNCLLQDQTGFIWVGTDDGLNRFDGYEVKIYRNDPNDYSSISENIIWAVWEDHSGNLWIGTKSGGLNKFDPLTNKFDHWELDSASPEEINITYIYEDSKSNIWIGTYHNGLYRFNPLQNKFNHWQNTSSNPKLLSDNFITSIIEDQILNIWIATYAGSDKFNPQNNDSPFNKVIPNFKNPIWYLTKSTFIESTIWMGQDYTIDVQAASASDDPFAAGNLCTTNRYYPAGHTNQFQIKSIEYPNGTMSIFANATNNSWATNWTGRPNTARTQIAEGTKTITTYGEVHEITRVETYDVSPAHPSGVLVSQEIRSGFDDLKRSYTAAYLDGSTEAIEYACCGLSSTTDRTGAVTEYLYDSLKRRIGSRVNDDNSRTSTNLLSAAGRVLRSITAAIVTEDPEVTMAAAPCR